MKPIKKMEDTAVLDNDSVRRLVLGFIAHKQDILARNGLLDARKRIVRYQSEMLPSELDELSIDEATLGFDSLSRLDLVFRVNTFFNLYKTGVEDYLVIRPSIGDWITIISNHLNICKDKAVFSFQTSGSTGHPKMVCRAARELVLEIDAFLSGQVFPLKSTSRIVSLVPVYHIYGFIFSCLLPSRAGLEAFDLHHLPTTSAVRYARSGDIVVATPFLWQRMVQTALEFAPDVHGISSSSCSKLETWSVIEHRGLAGLAEVYGSTETGAVGYRKAYQHYYELMPHLVRDGCEVRHLFNNNIRVNLQDQLEWADMRHFSLVGRLDKAVQVAGVNVCLSYVSETIRSIRGVRSVQITLEEGSIQAVIEPESQRSNLSKLQSRVLSHVNANLEPAARPSQLLFKGAYTELSTADVAR